MFSRTIYFTFTTEWRPYPPVDPPPAESSDADSSSDLALPPDPASGDDDWWNRPFDPDKWDPFGEMQGMRERMNRMFDGASGDSPHFRNLARETAFSPEVDLRDDGDRFVVHVDLPGVEQSNINVEVIKP